MKWTSHSIKKDWDLAMLVTVAQEEDWIIYQLEG